MFTLGDTVKLTYDDSLLGEVIDTPDEHYPNYLLRLLDKNKQLLYVTINGQLKEKRTVVKAEWMIGC